MIPPRFLLVVLPAVRACLLAQCHRLGPSRWSRSLPSPPLPRASSCPRCRCSPLGGLSPVPQRRGCFRSSAFSFHSRCSTIPSLPSTYFARLTVDSRFAVGWSVASSLSCRHSLPSLPSSLFSLSVSPWGRYVIVESVGVSLVRLPLSFGSPLHPIGLGSLSSLVPRLRSRSHPVLVLVPPRS